MSDSIVYDYTNPKYDKQRNQWYWEGRRTDTGKKVRKYDTGQGQTTQAQANQYDPTGYQSTSYHATGGIEAGMQAMNLQQQPVDPYNTNSSNYVTWQTEVQPQGPPTYIGDSAHDRRRDEGIPSDYQMTPRTMPVSSGYQAPSASTSQQFPQPPLTTSQGTAHSNVPGQPSYTQVQSAPVGYGHGGDAGSQWSNSRHDKYVAVPHSGQPKSNVQTNVGKSYDDSYYGTTQSHYAQCVVYAPVTGSQRSAFQDSPSNFGVTGDDDDDPELRAGIEASHRMYGYGGAGETSRQGGSAYRPDPGVVPPTTPHSRTAKNHISGTTGQFEPLDKSQACRKHGVKPSKHGIVCEDTKRPALLQSEPELGFAPIRMHMTAANEHISKESRVNYSKLITVEHNVKVFFIGQIDYEDWPIVERAVDDCWGAKNREKSHHSHHNSRRVKR
ncbi:hypothetical protein VM1G_06704 [Cytospora mali]|uniref:DUF6590 domain-containing protein n=1 Tax=Cytospora mali TaxID=578113 RepID=A0A194W5R1_CYTMA|nr:hypothetical protein VM1G_06704 [Valsa mali]